MSKIWFITGCSTGFGRELALIVAQKGDIAIGTLRKAEQIADFNQLAPGHTFGVQVDVQDDVQIQNAIEATITQWGRIDVLVNNAGMGILGAIEEVPMNEVQRQFDVNVFGAIRLIKAVLPHMRKQRSGHILNITSIAGIQGYPGVGIYNGSKFALEGIGEALAKEVSHLGIKVINIEPGPFRTDWAGRSATFYYSGEKDYSDTADKNAKSIEDVSGKQMGDPVKGALAMYEIVQSPEPPMHLPLGGPAYKRFRKKLEELKEELDAFEYLGLPTDFDSE